jgi:uncharacterized protein (TIGR02145 family)
METVRIGNTEWTNSNISCRAMLDGSPMIIAQTLNDWVNACNSATPCAAAYNFDDKNIKKYGLLYNSFAVRDAALWVPEGWRISTRADWEELMLFGGSNIPADKYTQSELLVKLKSEKGWKGKINFTYPLNGTNELGFNALPGGELSSSYNLLEFYDIGTGCGWWTSEYHYPHITSYDKLKFGILPRERENESFDYLNLESTKSKSGLYIRLVKE